MFYLNVILKDIPLNIQRVLVDNLSVAQEDLIGVSAEFYSNNFEKSRAFIVFTVDALDAVEAFEDVLFLLNNADLADYLYSIEVDK